MRRVRRGFKKILHRLPTLWEEEEDPNGNLLNSLSGVPQENSSQLESVLRALVKSQGVSWGRLGEDGHCRESNKINVLLCQFHLNYIHPSKALESPCSRVAELAGSSSHPGQVASVPPALGVDHLKVTPSLPPSPAFYAQVSAPGLLALRG